MLSEPEVLDLRVERLTNHIILEVSGVTQTK